MFSDLGDTRALLRCMSLNDLESQLRASLLPSSSRSSLIAQFITALLSHEGENQIHEPIVPPIPAPTTTPPITISIKQEDVPQETRESSRKVTHRCVPTIKQIHVSAIKSTYILGSKFIQRL